ncbi:hypothetical protein Zmor_001467 [Zophobas morio]|uniref:Uncharacterized protein n=1 Tax=Zophobas morio TaxID=2755281 RepID=A0AA38MSN1_9CUCU|nr:hypothetical protein Zmor_026579 [Zophobas morio]KAJ3666007.1 hypothetical protein Zmor_001467 [Zophobas morio]
MSEENISLAAASVGSRGSGTTTDTTRNSCCARNIFTRLGTIVWLYNQARLLWYDRAVMDSSNHKCRRQVIPTRAEVLNTSRYSDEYLNEQTLASSSALIYINLDFKQ